MFVSLFYFADICVTVMSSALETLLEAAQFIELQEREQRERRLTSTSSSSTSSLSTSPYSNSRYQTKNNQNYTNQSLVTTPPASPISDGQRHHGDFGSNGTSTIIRTGKFIIFYFTQIVLYWLLCGCWL